MGRPTKLTVEISELIVTMIEGGVPRHHAARAAGIAPSTLFLWMARGEAESGENIDPTRHRKAELIEIAQERDVEIAPSWAKARIAEAINAYRSPYLEFSDRVRAADSRFMAFAIGNMRQTGSDDWRMWDRLLERRFPELRVHTSTDDEGSGETLDQEAAQKAIERAAEIRVKMLGAGS